MAMLRSLAAALLLLAAFVAPARAAGEKLALFDFELINTSLEPTRPDEVARLGMIKEIAAGELARHGFVIVDTDPVAAEANRVQSLRGCNGCDLDLARLLGADLSAVGWVQKVSNLILNINLQIRDVATGRLVHAGSVDIRGNTDESWRRGITYLINWVIFRDPSRSPAKG